MIPNPEVSELQSKFEKMRELDFTKSVVIPLFGTIGFKTDDHGGPYEEGKDIIFWETNAFREIECGVAQVKKIRTRVSTRSDKSFSDLINQLQQATEKKIPALDGNLHLPRKVIFVTPYNIDTRSLQTRFEKYQELKNERVTILDGAKVAELLISNCPSIAREMLGHDTAIETATLTNLSNDTLMRALQFSNVGKIEDYYCDLDFALRRQSNYLLTADLKSKRECSEKVLPERLSVLLEIHRVIFSNTNITLIRDTKEMLSEQKIACKKGLKAKAAEHLVPLAIHKHRLLEQIIPQDNDKIDYKPWVIFSQKLGPIIAFKKTT